MLTKTTLSSPQNSPEQKISNEELRIQQILKEFDHCARCGGQIQFRYETENSRTHIIEAGSCGHCQSQIPRRKYRIL